MPAKTLSDRLHSQAAATAAKLIADKTAAIDAWDALVTWITKTIPTDADFVPALGYSNDGSVPSSATISYLRSNADARVWLADLSKAMGDDDWVLNGICACDTSFSSKADGAVTAELAGPCRINLKLTVNYKEPF